MQSGLLDCLSILNYLLSERSRGIGIAVEASGSVNFVPFRGRGPFAWREDTDQGSSHCYHTGMR